MRPQSAGRLVYSFDFEERESNPGEVPANWVRAQDEPSGLRRHGFPSWNLASLVYRQDGGQPYAGDGVVVLPTRGGSTSLLLSTGVVPVFANADYRVSVRVRTAGLVHAGAAVTVRLLDDAGREVPGSEVRAGPNRFEKEWGTLSVDVLGRGGSAAWLQIELQLLQPEQATGDAATPPHHVWNQDHAGQALFDDVLVLQLPRVEVASTVPGGVVVSPETPRVAVQVRDLTGEKLSLICEAMDAAGVVVDRYDHAGGSGLINTAWQPRLPAYGWYRVNVRVATATRTVDQAHTDLVWLGPRTGAAATPAAPTKFGVVLDDLPDEALPIAPALAARVGAGTVTLPFWTSSLEPKHVAARAALLAEVVGALLADWREVTLSLPETPAGLARSERLEPLDPLAALCTDPRAWRPYAGAMFEKLGARAQRWQIGRAGSDATYWRPDRANDLRAAAAAIAALAPGPRLSLGGRVDRAWPAADHELVLLVPSDLEPDGVRLAGEQVAEDHGANARLVFEPIPSGHPSLTVPHLARQVIEAWAGLGPKAATTPVLLAGGWDWVGTRRPQLVPRPEVAAWRTLAQQLAYRRVEGEFPIAPGVRCLMLAPIAGADESHGPALVAWSEFAAPGKAMVAEFLGEGTITVTDLYGNTTPAPEMPPASDHALPGVRIPLALTPVFIEGIDLAWCRFVALLRLEPATLDTTGQMQERHVVLSNSWASSMAGTITVVEPGGGERGERDRTWRISPRTARFQAAAGEVVRLPLSIGFSPVEEGGPREFVFEVEVQSDRNYGPVRVRRSVMIGAPGLRLDVTARAIGNDVFAEAILRNTGTAPISLRMTAFAPGRPRAKASIHDLAAARQTTKRFRFPDAASELTGQRIVVSVEDPDTGARLVGSAVVR
ncbi:MAG: hypothetical protein HBSAPP03_12720 [Phycisphaerae bacterium]|nr:MAG: hypothetical protein HBSAPP03_12720 [Phycisphaerae bacterium]